MFKDPRLELSEKSKEMLLDAISKPPPKGSPFIIRVIKASKKTYWYAKHIEDTFEVYRQYPGHVDLVSDNSRSIFDGDFENV